MCNVYFSILFSITIFHQIFHLQNEKAQLHTHRSSMLRLNASVHSWLTRQEMKMAKLTEQNKQKSTNVMLLTTMPSTSQSTGVINSDDVLLSNNKVNGIATDKQSTISTETHDGTTGDDGNVANEELHKRLKNEVGDMYSAWDEADQR